jgi:hypothetical protein
MPEEQGDKPPRRRLRKHQHWHCRVCGRGGQPPTATRSPADNDLFPTFGARKDGGVALACRVCREKLGRK